MKSILKHIGKNWKTTSAGVLGIIGLFTPVSPAVIAAAGMVGLILASDPKKEEVLPKKVK